MRLCLAFAMVFFCVANAYAGSADDMSSPLVYLGAVDGSAAVALDTEHYVAASDEDSILRVYRRNRGGPASQSIDLTQFLEVPTATPETDLEAAARIGDRVYWISSHGCSSRGNRKTERYRFFATDLAMSSRGVNLSPVGKPYKGLLRDLTEDRQLESLKLAKAAARAPKSAGGLSIEGLCATPDAHLLIGFRNPIPQGRALLVPLLNPDAVVQGHRAQFGPPVRLNMGGLGVRDMAFWHGECLIIAGSPDGKGQSRLYRWAGDAKEPRLLNHISFRGLNPEAVIIYPDNGLQQVQLLSDDSNIAKSDNAGKTESVLQEKRFRSIWVSP